jgi:hypothetical protein
MATNMSSLTQQMSIDQYERMKREEMYMRKMQQYDPYMAEMQYGNKAMPGLGDSPKPEPKPAHQNPKLLLTRKA